MSEQAMTKQEELRRLRILATWVREYFVEWILDNQTQACQRTHNSMLESFKFTPHYETVRDEIDARRSGDTKKLEELDRELELKFPTKKRARK